LLGCPLIALAKPEATIAVPPAGASPEAPLSQDHTHAARRRWRADDPRAGALGHGDQNDAQLPGGDAGGVYGLKTMVQEQKAELTIVKNDIQVIRDALTSHVAKEDVIYEIFKRVMNTGVSITGALFALLLSVIGYLLVNPVGLH
jgi:hypothetical protein